MDQTILTRTNDRVSSSHKLIYIILALLVIRFFTEDFIFSWSSYIFHLILSFLGSGTVQSGDDHHTPRCERILNQTYIWRNIELVGGNWVRELNMCAGNNARVQLREWFLVQV